MWFIILALSFLGVIVLIKSIRYLKYSFIPKSFIPLESKIVCFEERIKWRDATDSGNPKEAETYYTPIIEYTFNNEKHTYQGQIPIRFETYNFNRKIVLYINPKKTSDVRHKVKHYWE